MTEKFRRTIKISDALLALKLLGPRIFTQNLKTQLYSQIPFLCLGKELDRGYPSQEIYKGFTLLPASSEDVENFFQLMVKESKSSQYELLVRKRFYERGFRDCYIGREDNSNEMCCIVWMVTPTDVKNTHSANIYPGLKKDELFAENIYTLEKFRGKGVMTSTGFQQEEIARKLGFKRMFFYVKEDNISSLKSCKRRGHLTYSKLLRCHFLFHVKIQTTQRFNPAIPIVIPQ